MLRQVPQSCGIPSYDGTQHDRPERDEDTGEVATVTSLPPSGAGDLFFLFVGQDAVAEHFQSGGFHFGSGGCLKATAFAQRRMGDGCSDSTEFFENGRINSKRIAFTVD